MNTAITWFLIGALTGTATYPITRKAWDWFWRDQNKVVDDYIRKHPCFPEDFNHEDICTCTGLYSDGIGRCKKHCKY